MIKFETIEVGTVDGTSYYVARRQDGWTRCWVKRKKNTRRSMSWLRKQKKKGLVKVYWSNIK